MGAVQIFLKCDVGVVCVKVMEVGTNSHRLQPMGEGEDLSELGGAQRWC